MEKHATTNYANSLGYRSETEQTEFVVGAIAHLEAITGRKLDSMAAQSWLARLKKYPKWKITELGEYTGWLDNRVLEYLNALQRPEQSQTAREELGYHGGVKSLEDLRAQQKSSIGKDFCDHIRSVVSFDGTREQRIRFELESLKKLDEKYPRADVSRAYGEKRFVELGLS